MTFADRNSDAAPNVLQITWPQNVPTPLDCQLSCCCKPNSVHDAKCWLVWFHYL